MTPDGGELACRTESAVVAAPFLVDTADIPGGGKLQLVQHGLDFEILLGTEQLMSSWSSGSEEALARLACERVSRNGSRVLIGGLGMGFTLAAALKALPAGATILVAELVPKIVGWAGGALSHLFGTSLADPRVSLQVRDIHDVITEQPDSFDAILLDVDNGPDGLTSVANERLYCDWGLRAARAALRPNGVLGIWSAYPDDAFLGRLEYAGFVVDELRMSADGGRESREHVIWLATRGD